MSPVIVVIGVFCIVSVVHCLAIGLSAKRTSMATKPLLLPLLLVFYLLAAEKPEGFVVAALAAGFLGDVLLMGPGIFFTLGLAAFLTGHLFYMAALLSAPAAFTWTLAAAVIPYVLAGAVFVRTLWPHIDNKMRIQVVLYTCVELAMGYAALLRGLGSPGPWTPLLIAGSLLFIVSDTLLAFNMFIGEHRWRSVAVMITYLAGQAMLAAAFVLLPL